MHLAKHTCPSSTIRDSYGTLCHSGKHAFTSTYHMFAVLHQKKTESQPCVHHEPHLQLTVRNSYAHSQKLSVHVHDTKIRGGTV